MRIVDIKFDDYIQEKYHSERLQLDLRMLENCLKATQGIDKVYNFAANMGGIGFITSVSADVMHDNVLINTNMIEASIRNNVRDSCSAQVLASVQTTSRQSPMSKD